MAREYGEPLLMLTLGAGEYQLDIAPERGGSVLRFDWNRTHLFRRAEGPSALDAACFPLVPFSNRIAFGRFDAGRRPVALARNFPGTDHPHTLHGFGWLSQWRVTQADGSSATLEHHYPGGEWPWPYFAEQKFALSREGLVMTLSIVNLGEETMPAGLGFHPYFPCDADTVYYGLHQGEWHNSADCLPERLDLRAEALDWWDGAAVGQRSVDTVYAHRAGPLRIDWPSRGLSLEMTPDPALRHTVVYTPKDAGFFCVEPVTHRTDALNAEGTPDMRWLSKGEKFSAGVTLQASEFRPKSRKK
jgi:aldose 1-epimerase